MSIPTLDLMGQNPLIALFAGAAFARMCLYAGLSWYVAGDKRRDRVGWAVLGFPFGLVPLLVVLFLPGKPEHDAPYPTDARR